MYNFSINVDYKNDDDDESYRDFFIKVFNISDYNSETIFKTLDWIISEYSKNENFMEVIRMSKSKYNESENIHALMYLFSWDHFDLFHLFLRSLKNNTNNDNILLELKKLLCGDIES
jgi:hypothetical protein